MSKQGRDQNRTRKAAAIRAEQERKERNRRVALIAGILVVLCAIVAGGAWYSAGGSSDKTTTSSDAPPVAAGSASLKVGDPDAPVKVVVFEDFLCPFCRELESSTRSFLQENAAKGKVYVEYQPINILTEFPYSAKALNAWAAVLKNASPEAALKLHDILYDNQPYEQSSGEVTDSQIAGWVKEAGGDNAEVRAAMKTRDDVFFGVAQQAASSAGIQGTPTVFVNGKELPATDVATMVSTIEKAVDQAS